MTDEAKALVEIYWEAMNLGRTNKEIDMDPEDGWVNEQGPNYIRGEALHDFARRIIKPALAAIGVNPLTAKRHYRDMSKRITADEARQKYMDPQFINRANARMSREELSALILHHAKELRWLMEEYYPPFATGNYHGTRLTKKRLVELANQLHDCWNACDLHKSARAGAPILWEE